MVNVTVSGNIKSEHSFGKDKNKDIADSYWIECDFEDEDLEKGEGRDLFLITLPQKLPLKEGTKIYCRGRLRGGHGDTYIMVETLTIDF